MLTRPAPNKLGSDTTTLGIRVAVTPKFLPDQSDAYQRRFTFGYHIRIDNESQETVRLLSRYWLIVDSHGRSQEVRGDGVVGQQPRLGPGESHEYSSFCPLSTPWGTMEGSFTMRRDDGSTFEVAVGRFYLAAPSDTPR